MKKMFIIFICLFLIVGCKDKNHLDDNNNEEDNFVIEKREEDKGYVYLTDYKKIKYNNEEYILQNIVININGESIDNINLELRSFVARSFKDMEISDGVLKKGNIISYDYYVNDKYISIIQRYYPYIDGVIGEEEDNVYVLSLDSGKLVEKNELLRSFEYNEDELLNHLEENLKSDDVAYSIMNIKNNGYKLYVNKDNRLVIIYYEIDDNESKRKELAIN